jgi:hypothetical protein
MKDM